MGPRTRREARAALSLGITDLNLFVTKTGPITNEEMRLEKKISSCTGEPESRMTIGRELHRKIARSI
jgi:hypothetical protein